MSKQTQIVCQHLEDISRAALEEYQDIVREYVRKRHGIYALYRRGKLHYVGLASNLRVRLKQHLHDRHKDSWDRFSIYLTIDNNAIKELETLLLRIVSPTGNRTGGRFVRSENLALRLKKDIRQRHREKELDLVPGSRRKTTKKSVRKKEPTNKSIPLAGYVKKPMRMRVKYKGKTYRARIRRDGTKRLLPQVTQFANARPMAGSSGKSSAHQAIGCRLRRFESKSATRHSTAIRLSSQLPPVRRISCDATLSTF